MDAPRDNLTRSVPFHLERADENDDGWLLHGYAAVFDSVTRIDSWEGEFDEEILRGAWKKTLREQRPVVMFDHGKHPFIGSMPLGPLRTGEENDHGVYVEVPLHRNWMMEPIRDAVRSGAIPGMSFRFSAVREKWTERAGTVPLRQISELRCAELGPVVFPAYEATSVGMRSDVDRFLDDPSALVDLARALILRTSSDDAAQVGTSSDDAATHSAPPSEGHPGMSPDARARVLTLMEFPS